MEDSPMPNPERNPELFAVATGSDEDYGHEGKLPRFVWANLGGLTTPRFIEGKKEVTMDEQDVDEEKNVGVYSIAQICQDLPNNRLTICVGTGDEKVRVLTADLKETEAEFQEEAAFYEPKETVVNLDLSSDGSLLAAASLDGNVQLYRVSTTADGKASLTVGQQLSGPEEDIEDLVWSPQGKVCMAVSIDRTAWLWKAESDFFKVLIGHEARLIHGFFTKIQRPGSDKEMVAAVTTSADGTVIVWDPAEGTIVHKILVCPNQQFMPEVDRQDRSNAVGIISASLHPTKPVLAIGTADGEIILANLTSGHVAARRQLLAGIVESVAFSPKVVKDNLGDFLLAAGDSNGAIKICNASTLDVRHSLDHLDSPGGSCTIIKTLWVDHWPAALLSVGSDSKICMWDPRDGRQIEAYHTLEDEEISSSIIAKGKEPESFFVVVGTEQGSVYAWQLE